LMTWVPAFAGMTLRAGPGHEVTRAFAILAFVARVSEAHPGTRCLAEDQGGFQLALE